MDPVDAFSSSYEHARERFRELVSACGGESQPYPIGQAGPDGSDLTIDIARIGPEDANNLLVLSSGTHGIEGFFGSAVQISFLEALRAGRELPEGVALLLIHAMNPYGFAFIRRVNENNIDLNRNFLTADQSPEGTDPAYRKLNPMLNPETPPGGVEFFLGRTVLNILRHGYRSLKNAVVQGQYDFPKGLFYGGTEPSSTVNILREHLPAWVGSAKRVIHLDWHTGMGKWGTYILATSRSITAPEVAWLKSTFGSGSVEALDPSGVLYEIRGVLGRWLEDLFQDRDYNCLLVEFGTYPSLKVLRALRAENRAHHWGGPDHPETPAAKALLREAFAPASIAWRRDTVARANRVITQALRALES